MRCGAVRLGLSCRWWFVIAAVAFRLEVCLLLAPVLLLELYTGRLVFASGFMDGLISGVVTLATTILVDSWFWRVSVTS